LEKLKVMARAAKATTNTKLSASRKAPVKAAKPSAAAKRASVATPAGLKLGKDALRAEVEKLERRQHHPAREGQESQSRRQGVCLADCGVGSPGGGTRAEGGILSPAPVKCGPTAARAMAQEPAQLDEAVEAAVEKLEEDLGDF
jgi:hypothetical protein